jgi:hypothetical protein
MRRNKGVLTKAREKKIVPPNRDADGLVSLPLADACFIGQSIVLFAGAPFSPPIT